MVTIEAACLVQASISCLSILQSYFLFHSDRLGPRDFTIGFVIAVHSPEYRIFRVNPESSEKGHSEFDTCPKSWYISMYSMPSGFLHYNSTSFSYSIIAQVPLFDCC